MFSFFFFWFQALPNTICGQNRNVATITKQNEIYHVRKATGTLCEDGQTDRWTDGWGDGQTKRQQENHDLYIYHCKKKLVIVTQGTIWAETRKQMAQTLHAQFLPSDITGLFPFLNTM